MGEAGRMPTAFIGHGSPMNAIEDNRFTENWKRIARAIPRPEAVLCVSAHWYAEGLRVSDLPRPRMIYDMYGFPEELYELKYPALGSPSVAREALRLLGGDARADGSWGLDHGAWSVLARMYPLADIPVFQVSVDGAADARAQFEAGRRLSPLRDEGVLILGSGNVVHNLARVDWEREGGYPWALEFDAYVKERVAERRFEDLIDHRKAGDCARSAFTTPDHYYPLLTVLGAAARDDEATVYNEECVMGSLSMTCYLFA